MRRNSEERCKILPTRHTNGSSRRANGRTRRAEFGARHTFLHAGHLGLGGALTSSLANRTEHCARRTGLARHLVSIQMEPRRRRALRRSRTTTAWVLLRSFSRSTPPHEPRGVHSFSKIHRGPAGPQRVSRFSSPSAAALLPGNLVIGQKIIGRSVPVRALRFSADSDARFLCGAVFAMLYQPPRQHRRRVLFDPRFQQLMDLLAQVCGVAQTRELVALQRITRSSEQKLPRGLGPVRVQRGLLTVRVNRNRGVIVVNSTRTAEDCGNVWKFDRLRTGSIALLNRSGQP